MDTIELYIQVDVHKNASEKPRAKCTLLSTPLKERYVTEIGFTAYHQGITRNGFTSAIDRTGILIAHLYWTPESYKDKRLLNKISQQLFFAIKQMINSRNWEYGIESLQDEGWKIHEYWTLE